MRYLKRWTALALLLTLAVACNRAAVSTSPTTQTKSNGSQPLVDLLIEHGQVVTMDNAGRIFSDGWIAVDQGKIVALGDGQPKYAGRQTINVANQAVLPGLINTHSHSAMTLLRGLDDHQNLQDWLRQMAGYERKLTPDNVYWGSLLAIAEMLASGTTTFNDMYFFPEQTLAAARESGMRAVLRLPVSFTNEKLSVADIATATTSAGSLVSYALAPNPLLNYSIGELTQISDYALAKNLPVHIHFLEDALARQDLQKKYQLSPVELLIRTGLSRNRLILAHGVDLNAKEISQLAGWAQTSVAVSPKSEAKLSAAMPQIATMLSAGLNVSWATDGAASSDSLDLFGQMNFAAYGFLKCDSSAEFCANQYTVSAKTILAMATISAAKTLGLESSIGSLEVGKQADIITVNLNRPDATPAGDIYSTLVYNTNGSDVENVLVAGKILVRDGKLLTLDFPAIKTQTEKIRQTLIQP